MKGISFSSLTLYFHKRAYTNWKTAKIPMNIKKFVIVPINKPITTKTFISPFPNSIPEKLNKSLINKAKTKALTPKKRFSGLKIKTIKNKEVNNIEGIDL